MDSPLRERSAGRAKDLHRRGGIGVEIARQLRYNRGQVSIVCLSCRKYGCHSVFEAACSKGVRALDDLFDKNPAAGEQPGAEIPAGETRVMPPVESVIVQSASRRRRTERNQETYNTE